VTDIEDLFADLPPAKVKFWVCPDHRGGQVQWVGNLAYCLTCGRTNSVTEFLTTAELDALPEGTPIIDRHRDILTKRSDGLWHSYETRPMWSAKVTKWRARLATPAEVAGALGVCDCPLCKEDLS
jgi:hypothetical protein